MIKIGIIGCGKIAQTRHLPEYATNPDAKLVGYYDKISSRAVQMAEKYGGKVYDSYYDLINDPEIDAVSVFVENRNHAEITNAALYAGKHVLVEKPMAVTLAECESMVAAAEFNGKHLMVGHNMRFDPVHRRAKELLEAGVAPCSVLKVPHHGRLDALSGAFFAAAAPQIAVVTSDEDEPEDDEVIALLREQGAQTLLTREGEIVCVSDGKTVSARQKN